MNLTPVKMPLMVKKILPNYIWNMPDSEKNLYLTFDDGPTPEITNWVLETLNMFDAKATFFCIGKNIENYKDIFQNILDNRHSIGNHTNNHLKGWRTPTKDYLENIDKAQKIINSQLENRDFKGVNLFRPPYGQIRPKQGKALANLGFKVVMWNVLSFDWDKTISKKDCLNNVISNCSNGSIVVFHDSVKAEKNMKYALPRVLEHYKNQGYTFKPINLV